MATCNSHVQTINLTVIYMRVAILVYLAVGHNRVTLVEGLELQVASDPLPFLSGVLEESF